MLRDLINFQYENQPVRTVIRDGEPWFVAKDVCVVLEISNPTMALERLDDDERAKFNLGRQGETNIINEAGLYSLILGSRKPEARAFKRWITHEVLPSIRKTGGYQMSDALPQTVSPDIVVAEIISRLSTSEIIAILEARVTPAEQRSTGMLDIVMRGPKKGNRRHSKIDRFQVGDQVNDMLRAGHTYAEVMETLTGNGYPISIASVGRYAKRYLEAMKRTEIRLPGGMRLAEEVRPIN